VIGSLVLALALALWTPPEQAREQPAEALAGEQAFEQAVAAYRGGDWQSAATLWRGLLGQAGIDQPSVLYNLGNAAWREARPLEAAAWYTACLRLAPRHRDAWANLEFVRAAAGVEPADRGDLRSTARRLVYSLDRGESEWLALACAALFTAALCTEAVRGGALARRLALASALVLALGLTPWIAHLARAGARPLFVVAAEGGALRSAPAADAALVGRLAPASEAEYRDALPGWVRARAGSAEGWVEASAVQELEFRAPPASAGSRAGRLPADS
jgi:hypothetical protein